MAPIGTYFRRNGEQVIVHHCLGCAVERHCRAAADDHFIACMRLELVESQLQITEAAAMSDDVSA